MRILLVEDESSIIQVLQTVLTAQNYVVDVAQDGLAGWELVESFPYDLVLLDVMMPKLDGISFCRRLRETGNSVLVMLLTARDTTTDKLIGLDAGADDYMVKPFDIQELSARIRALLRRSHTPATTLLTCGELCLDPNSCEVTYADQPLPLSRKEYLLLELFLRHPTRVFSRSAIIDQVWSFSEDPPDEDTIKSHIKSIRRKLNAVGAGNLIETLYGQGYRINPIHWAEESSSPKEIAPTTAEQAIHSAVADIWARTKGVCLERVQFLAQAIQQFQIGRLDAETRQQAIAAAHKLVGTLGTFGFEAGSHWAQQIEWLLQSEAITDNRLPPQAVIEQAGQWMSALSDIVDDRSDPPPSPPPIPANHPPLGNNPLRLLIVEPDQEAAAKLAAEALLWQCHPIVVPDVSAARQQLQTQAIEVVLLDPWLPAQSQEYQELCYQLAQQMPPIAIAIFSNQESSQHRLEAITLGCQLFIAKPASPTQVMQAITTSFPTNALAQATILAVDDDQSILVMLGQLFQTPQIRLVGLEEPTQVWETLRRVQPDLLVLDIAMPEVNGLDLCRTVRQDAQWNWLPIVFFSGQAAPEMRHHAYLCGADDYLPKSIPTDQLVSRIHHRLQRSEALRHQVEVDLTTGLLDRTRATSALDLLLHLALRSQQVVSLAVLVLDPLPNHGAPDERSHPDPLIRQFGQFLQQQFRRTDVVARWRGTEFVIGMYGIRREDGIERIAEVLEVWRAERSNCLSPELLAATTANLLPSMVSFSAGVAEFPADGMSLMMLYRTAEAALYRAIQAGCDRVWSASAIEPSSGTTAIDVLLVSGDPRFIQVIGQALETRGYSIQCMKTGATVLDRLLQKESRLRTRVLLLQDSLPDMDSLYLLQQIGPKLMKQIRIIPILQNRTMAHQAQTLGVFDYLLHPCSPSVVMNCLRQALRHSDP